MITEDYERMSELDEMYLMEARMREEEEYRQWEEEQAKLPAKIVLLTPVKKEELK